MSSPLPTRAGAVALLTGSLLGLLPPIAGGEVPPAVVRIVGLDERELVPVGARRVASPSDAVSFSRKAWSRPVSACSSETFTMAGLIWRQTGEEIVSTRLSWNGQTAGRALVVADPFEGPDPGSPDDTGLNGTPPTWTGTASCLDTSLRLPAGTTLRDVRAVFVDTSDDDDSLLERAGDLLAWAWGMVTSPFTPSTADALTIQPPIIPRATWGADERIRRCEPDYAPSLKMAFVHHTVNSNAYTRSEADDLIRGIYAYHVQGRKYCDIAYNFVIDRFGRIYEGRYGGIEQPVIGAHAMGFNTSSTGVAALGTFTKEKPPRKVISAYKRLLAWRLDVAHLRPTATAVMTSGGGSTTKFEKGEQVVLPVISGHRDTGLTSCPGAKLYEKLPAIRAGAEGRGLPKIWDPYVSPNPAPVGTTQIQLAAKLSQEMDWSIEITNSATPTTVFKRYSGRGTDVLVTWDRTGDDPLSPPAPPGSYLVTFRAGEAGLTARDAVVTLSLS